MKKNNKSMRFAVVLLILALVTCAFVGGTMAKYVTSGNGTDSARVAKWGVTVTATSNSAFKSTYEKNSDTTITNTVVASENVVAPGTSGTLTDVTITGTPEVAIEVDYAADLSLTNWNVTGGEYCPIEITVEGTKYTCTGTVAEFEAAVEAAIAACSKEYEVGEITLGSNAPSVSWAWGFEGDNAKDTELGDNASKGTVIGISLTLTTTVTQID